MGHGEGREGLHTGETWKRNFARFGYAVIALDLAGHIAHNLFHLLSEGRSVLYTAINAFGGYAGRERRHARGNDG